MRASKTVGAFPGAEDRLDPAADLVDRTIPYGKFLISPALALSPDMSDDDTRLTILVDAPVSSINTSRSG